MSVRVKDIIAPSFYDLHKAVKQEKHTHFWLKGGRGSTKSSFIAIEVILGLMIHPEAHAMALRQYGVNLRDSVYEQLIWAIGKLGVEDYWRRKLTPLTLEYKPTGQKILFRGADDADKIKSVKAPEGGYFRYVWYEELDGFDGSDAIRKINQTLLRGGQAFTVFYSYNPPISVNSWVNQEALVPHPGRLTHHSTYLDVPEDWLGPQFILEADHVKAVRPDRYEHEYLGVPTGAGGEVFRNVTVRKITAEERAAFDAHRSGLDFGYASDPLAWVDLHYDKTRRRLFLLDEIYRVGLKLRDAAKMVKDRGKAKQISVCDSEDPRAIDELKELGLRVSAARKGPGSRDHGVKWLADLEEIIIDPETCPNAMREFTGYELEPDRFGGFKARYPEKNDHTIDATRYALEDAMRGPRFSW